MDKLKYFIIKYKGAIIGGIAAIIILILKLHVLLFWTLVIAFGIFIGNYIQNNKEIVKEKLKFFIDKL